MEQIQEALLSLLSAVLVAAIPIVVNQFRKWAKAQDQKLQKEMGETNYRLAMSVVENLVKAAEQIAMPDFTGEQKKQYVLSWSRALLTRMGVSFDAELVEHLLEAAVKGMNGGNDGHEGE